MSAAGFSFLHALGAGAPRSQSRMRDFARLLAAMGSDTPFDSLYKQVAVGPIRGRGGLRLGPTLHYTQPQNVGNVA
jgi:hypothetical protein